MIGIARAVASRLRARSGLPHGGDEIGTLAQTLDESSAAIDDRESRLDFANRALRVLSAGNRMDEARVLWAFRLPRHPDGPVFSFAVGATCRGAWYDFTPSPPPHPTRYGKGLPQGRITT